MWLELAAILSGPTTAVRTLWLANRHNRKMFDRQRTVELDKERRVALRAALESAALDFDRGFRLIHGNAEAYLALYFAEANSAPFEIDRARKEVDETSDQVSEGAYLINAAVTRLNMAGFTDGDLLQNALLIGEMASYLKFIRINFEGSSNEELERRYKEMGANYGKATWQFRLWYAEQNSIKGLAADTSK